MCGIFSECTIAPPTPGAQGGSQKVAGWDRQFVKKLWERVDRGERYDFPTGPMAQERLRDILPALPVDFFQRHPEQLNRPLREELAPHLKAGDQRSVSLARWIIRDWGGIKRGVQAIPEWMEAFGDFNEMRITAFIANSGTTRISSWSKLLAFANHENHAIYDARTSVALNCALRNLGDSRQFYMPLGQNETINDARRRVLNDVPEPRRPVGYKDYIELLNTAVACKLSNSILAAEMVLFANAPCVARQFVADGSEQRTP